MSSPHFPRRLSLCVVTWRVGIASNPPKFVVPDPVSAPPPPHNTCVEHSPHFFLLGPPDPIYYTPKIFLKVNFPLFPPPLPVFP